MATGKYDAHARPPDDLRHLFKMWQKTPSNTLNSRHDILNLDSLIEDERVHVCEVSESDTRRANTACREFLACGKDMCLVPELQVFEVNSLPGLFIYPALFPVDVQIALLNKLLHRDLSASNHKTNLHLHYHMPGTYTVDTDTSSLFELERDTTIHPKDPKIHKPISIVQALEKKLRWVTLGGQYDWTQKVYPREQPPKFPKDVADLLNGAFPSVDPQAAILNFYSSGDTLSLHRDVSEDCDRGLISLSIGCEALFLVANSDSNESVTIRLRSGDAILMSGKSRYAWHAVPKVLPGTCPPLLQSWPAAAVGVDHNQWRGWLANKRINLNVRQMRDEAASVSTDSEDP